MKLERVLLIDDSEVDNLVNRKVIEKSGHAENIVVFKAAQLALDYLLEAARSQERLLPDLIFLDIRMPEMDGFGFLAAFEQMAVGALQDIRIVMLSSSIDTEDYQKAMKSRFVVKFVNKPLSRSAVDEIAALSV